MAAISQITNYPQIQGLQTLSIILFIFLAHEFMVGTALLGHLGLSENCKLGSYLLHTTLHSPCTSGNEGYILKTNHRNRMQDSASNWWCNFFPHLLVKVNHKIQSCITGWENRLQPHQWVVLQQHGKGHGYLILSQRGMKNFQQ